jgi:hypothetical protein
VVRNFASIPRQCVGGNAGGRRRRETEMIGGLLRFAPGRLGARKGRAPWSCGSRRWAAYWLPWRVLGDELGTRGPARCCGSRMLSEAGMATGGATWARCVSRGWLEEVGGLLVGKTWAPGGCRAARLRVLPCPSPSRSFARYAAPAASLTASLWHGIGRRDRQARSLPQRTPRSPLGNRSIFVAVFVAVLTQAWLFRRYRDLALAGR